jgi:hypothetical protein
MDFPKITLPMKYPGCDANDNFVVSKERFSEMVHAPGAILVEIPKEMSMGPARTEELYEKYLWDGDSPDYVFSLLWVDPATSCRRSVILKGPGIDNLGLWICEACIAKNSNRKTRRSKTIHPCNFKQLPLTPEMNILLGEIAWLSYQRNCKRVRKGKGHKVLQIFIQE